MESKWRFNVWECGWSQSVISLVARGNEFDPPNRRYAQVIIGDQNLTLIGHSDMSGFVPSWTLLEDHFGQGWPFGLEVEPD